jgi:CPA2 family monovalent cation:H+ antiporter-2
LPGLGAPVPLRLDPSSSAVGKTLAQLNLRALTGATVLAIQRGRIGIVPAASEVLQAHDVVALAGTEGSIRAARELL